MQSGGDSPPPLFGRPTTQQQTNNTSTATRQQPLGGDFVRSSRDGYEDPPDFFHTSVDDDARRIHESRSRDVEADDAATLNRRLKDQTQLVQELTCQLNKLQRELDGQREELDRIDEVEMQNETLETKFKIQSETIKTQQVRVNDAMRERELAQKQSIEDSATIADLKKEVSTLSLKLQETLVALKNKTKEADHAQDAYDTLDQHAQQLRAANAALSDRVQLLEELVDRYEHEDLGAFFTRRGTADVAAAKSKLASSAGGAPSPSSPAGVLGGTNATAGGGGDRSRMHRSSPQRVSPSAAAAPRTSATADDVGIYLGQQQLHNNTGAKAIVTVPTPMYALDGCGTPIIPKPLPSASHSNSASVTAIGGVHHHRNSTTASSICGADGSTARSPPKAGGSAVSPQRDHRGGGAAAGSVPFTTVRTSIPADRGGHASTVSAARYGGAPDSHPNSASAAAGPNKRTFTTAGSSLPANTAVGVSTYSSSSESAMASPSTTLTLTRGGTSEIIGDEQLCQQYYSPTKDLASPLLPEPSAGGDGGRGNHHPREVRMMGGDSNDGDAFPTASSTPERPQNSTTAGPSPNNNYLAGYNQADNSSIGGNNAHQDASSLLHHADGVMQGRGVFQTLRQRRMEAQNEEARIREEVLSRAGGGGNSAAGNAFATASVD